MAQKGSVRLYLVPTKCMAALFGFIFLVSFTSNHLLFADAKSDILIPQYEKNFDENSAENAKILFAETWERPYRYDSYTAFRESPIHGRFVSVDEAGFRYVANQAPWPPDPNFLNIFLFGGSTLFGYGVTDEETIASQLQALLQNDIQKKHVRIYNFGCGHYYSTQERILFTKLLSHGFVPNLVIFIDGLNDFLRINDEPEFSNDFRKIFENSVQKIKSSYAEDNSTIKKISNLIRRSAPSYTLETESYADTVIKIYSQNKKISEAIANAYAIQTLFIWQPIPFYNYQSTEFSKKYPYLSERKVYNFAYTQIKEMNRKEQLGKNFFWLGDIQEGKDEFLYIDRVHYSSKFCKQIAELIYQKVIEKKLI